MSIAEQWQYCMEDRRVRSMDVNVAYDQIKGIIYSLRCFLVRHNVATDLSTESYPTSGDRFALMCGISMKRSQGSQYSRVYDEVIPKRSHYRRE